jgi:hypothetical protein
VFLYILAVGFLQGVFHASAEDIAREDRDPDRPETR